MVLPQNQHVETDIKIHLHCQVPQCCIYVNTKFLSVNISTDHLQQVIIRTSLPSGSSSRHKDSEDHHLTLKGKTEMARDVSNTGRLL
jgi:hypothetical protein